MNVKSCPCCGNNLNLPDRYLNAIAKLRDELEKFRPVIIKDFIYNDLKQVLFELAKSHGELAQAEYNRNPSYNNEHFSYKAEISIIDFLQKYDLYNDFIYEASQSEPKAE